MRKVYLLLFLLVTYSSSLLNAQSYILSAEDGNTINTCIGSIFDSGGQFGQYGNNENFIVTFCPDGVGGPGIYIDMAFVNLPSPDQVCFFDGTDLAAPFIGCYNNDFTNDTGGVQSSASNPTGCLTVQMFTDGMDTADGIEFNINCQVPCQTVLSEIISTTPAMMPADTGYIDICIGETVFFSAAGLYPENNVFYNQSDLTTQFFWNFGDDVNNLGFGPTTAHTYNEPGGYIVNVFLEDEMGCTSTNLHNIRVRVSPEPYFNGQIATETTVCSGDTVTISTGDLVPVSGNFIPASIRSDSLVVPDAGGSVSFETSISFNQFSPGATLQDVNDLINICINMEHSWMHDLGIWLTCPDGTQIALHEQISPPTTGGAGATFLGVPNDPDDSAAPNAIDTPWGWVEPGEGWTYCWTNDATNGTWRQYATNNNPGTLPEGDYNSFDPFSDLIGCPLNGDWTITVIDNWGIDNGYIYFWEINFDPDLFPDSVTETFTPQITDLTWSADPSIISSTDSTIVINPDCPGTATYTLTGTNEFGCSFDTTLSIVVLPVGDASCFNCADVAIDNLSDVTICDGDTATLAPFVAGADGSLLWCNPSVQNIPDGGVASGDVLNSTIDVSGMSGTILPGSIESVCVNINHPWNSDVDIWLISPTNQILELSTDNGGGGDNYILACFTPDATNPITSGTPPYTGNWLPEGNWNLLNGSAINGTWTLQVGDDGNGFAGSLLGWEITFTVPSSATFSWSPSIGLSCDDCPMPEAFPTSTTTYTVTATDNNGCMGMEDVTVTVTNQIPSPVVTCGAATDDSVTFDWNGNGPFEVSIDNGMTWVPASPGPNTHLVSGLMSGDMVTILVQPIGAANCFDGPGTTTCTASSSCIPITSSIVTTDVDCNGAMNGAIALNIIGGTAPLTFDWNMPLGNTDNPTGLSGGTYAVTVTDFDNCTQVFNNIVVNEPTDLTLTASGTNLLCNGAADGNASAFPVGGTTPYTYTWSNTAQTDQIITGLSGATYDLTVTDANGCSETASVVLTEPTAITLSSSSTPASCGGGTDGTASITAMGGTPAYTYNWDATAGNQTTAIATGLAFGTYIVTVTDANSCSETVQATVSEQANISYTMTGSALSCFGDNNGTADASVTMGTQPYTYLWDMGAGGQTTATATGLTAGTYTITITDATGCSAIDVADVTQPDLLIGSIIGTDPVCFGDNSGSVDLTPTGGTPPYTYSWSNGETTEDISNVLGGAYSVSLTDNNGCSTSFFISLTEPSALMTSGNVVLDVLCNGGNNGTAFMAVVGGTGPYTYEWDNGESDE
ncbi:MAG: proprotein convertase P-domain-containing protein, partial [Bacteroidota bacterium]